MANALGMKLNEEEKELTGKQLVKTIMEKWLSCADNILEMMIIHLPSPKKAQKYRIRCLYEGPPDDPIVTAMRECDPKGPLMVYASKIVPTTDGNSFFAFGRVFSGTISPGQKVRILGPNYTPGKKEDLHERIIKATVLMNGKSSISVQEVPCGNYVGIANIDQFLLKYGTITDNDKAYCIKNMKNMKSSVSPVVKIGVFPRSPAELPKMLDGLKKLAKSEPFAQINIEETGQSIIAGIGELHLEICLQDLREFYAKDIEIIQTEPAIVYRETVTANSSQVCLSKAPNKHNRL